MSARIGIRSFCALFLLFGCLSFNAQAAQEEEATHYRLFGGLGADSLSSPSGNYKGARLLGGIELPSSETDKQSIRFSASRIFDGESVDRYHLLLHAGYQFLPRFDAGLLLGVGCLDSKSPNTTYLKPIYGLEAVYHIKTFGNNALSAFMYYEIAQGSTGTIALDGGPDALSARIFSIGLMFSIGVLTQDQAPDPTKPNVATQ